MGLFRRVKDLVTADVHDVIDKLENPVVMLKQYMRDVEEQIGKAQHALADQLFMEKKYETLVEEAEAIVAKRVRQAQLAVDRGEDEVAQVALQEKITQEKKLAMYKQQLEATKKQTALLYDQIGKMQETFKELQYKKLVLISRANAAKALKSGQDTLASFQTEHTLKGFARMEEYIQKLEAEAAASQYFQQAYTRDHMPSVSSELKEEVQKELEKLKATK
ncbi:PspA/IM30 family protein [Ectobacillus sp. sgz5001026]|uniref:PspA/IM30 family protein n=1 Tax=Ectobacillus sp. sgz5001026 TaxID=3242473 RepID=UPI0036D31074